MMNPESSKTVGCQSDRVIAYDRARALAIVGMILVNASQMMKTARFEPWWLEAIINFITGRAAVIFVMLAGVGLVQAYERTSINEKPWMCKRMLFRAVLLGFTGGLLMNVWHADILHYYTAFILGGVCLLKIPTARMIRILNFMIFISVPVCILAAYESGGGGVLAAFFTLGPLALLFEYLFFGSYYPMIPWGCFFLLGMLIGRLGISLNKRRCRLILAVSCSLLIVIEAFSTALNSETMAGRWFDIEHPMWQALTASEAFPVTPLFLFSAGATGVALIALLRLWPRQLPNTSRWPGPMVAFGRMSLTMYIAHILIADVYYRWIIGQYGIASSNQVLFFMTGFSMAGITFAMIWARYFRRGPLELILNTMVHKLANLKKPAWSLRT